MVKKLYKIFCLVWALEPVVAKRPPLSQSRIKVNEDPPTLEEIQEAVKTFKNNKSFVTDNVPPKGGINTAK